MRKYIQVILLLTKNQSNMKKYLLIIVAALGLAACSSNNEPKCDEFVQPMQTTSVTLNQLKHLNDSVEVALGQVTTRSWQRNTVVALNDIYGGYNWGKKGAQIGGIVGSIFPSIGNATGTVSGAVIGAVIGASKYSYKAYKKLPGASEIFETPSLDDMKSVYCSVRSEELIDDGENEEIYNLDFPVGLDSIENIGIYHNLALDELIARENMPVALSDPDLDVDDPIIIAPSYELTQIESLVVDSDDFIEFYNSTINDEFNGDMSSLDFDNNSVADSVMRLYMELIYSYGDNVTLQDIINVTNQYINIVANSTELTADEKYILYQAFAVGAYSCSYWMSY